MNFLLGVKSDPIEYRYSYEWLFALMRDHGICRLQLGSFFEMYSLPDSYFYDLRALAERYNIRIKSVFTAHRELGGFFSGDARLSAVARENYERLIEVAALLGAEYAGSNPGAVYRDRMKSKERGIACYLSNMKELTHKAKELGLIGLSIEPMRVQSLLLHRRRSTL
jgi:ribulose-phosphate 3-epimerase